MNYQVNSIYRTIQGEGWHAGLPCTLVRMQGCNLRCEFCDTPQAQDPKGGETCNAEALLDQVRAIHRQGDIVLITGGEPTLQDLTCLTTLLAQLGPVHVETNGTGTVSPQGVEWLTISPKVQSEEDFKYWRGRTMDISEPSRCELKFLVDTFDDALKWLAFLERQRFYGNVSVQPISQGEEATKAAIKAALTFGWRLSIQQHKYIGVP